tara:strand:+ start:68 stop:556 length:489 start_codon:yes stop_codon:yes gene_type:complete
MKLLIKTMLISAICTGFIACYEEKKTVSAPKPKEEVIQKVMAKKVEPSLTQAEARVFFKNLKDGDVVTSPLTVEFGVEGMEVAKAGNVVELSGHHHLLINVDTIDFKSPVPSDETHIHYGGGQKTATVELKPGKHKLTMLFANGSHVPHAKPLTTSITVEVK